MPQNFQRFLILAASIVWLVIFAVSTLDGIRSHAAWVAPVVSAFCVNLCFVLLLRRSPPS